MGVHVAEREEWRGCDVEKEKGIFGQREKNTQRVMLIIALERLVGNGTFSCVWGFD